MVQKQTFGTSQKMKMDQKNQVEKDDQETEGKHHQGGVDREVGEIFLKKVKEGGEQEEGVDGETEHWKKRKTLRETE